MNYGDIWFTIYNLEFVHKHKSTVDEGFTWRKIMGFPFQQPHIRYRPYEYSSQLIVWINQVPICAYVYCVLELKIGYDGMNMNYV